MIYSVVVISTICYISPSTAQITFVVRSYKLPGEAEVSVTPSTNNQYDIPAGATVTLRCEITGGTPILRYSTLDAAKVTHYTSRSEWLNTVYQLLFAMVAIMAA